MSLTELILASASPRRKLLLEQIGLSFQVFPSHVQEPDFAGNNPAKYALELAGLKAREISDQFPTALVIGADTIVVIDDEVLGKPLDRKSARSMLTRLSDRQHQVITAYSLSLKDAQIIETYHVVTQVRFKKLSQRDIDCYISTGSPFDKAGAYGIQDFSSIFVERIDGCFYNVVGLPISHLYEKLNKLLSKYSLTLK